MKAANGNGPETLQIVKDYAVSSVVFPGGGFLKRAALFAVICLLIPVTAISSALSETLGFGFVNNKDVALRRGIGGKIIVRLPENACVWIRDSGTDREGVLWYEINAGLHTDHANVDYTGWMKAEFVDAGDALWHGIQSVKASGSGMVALKTDGTAVSAGSLAAPEPSDWTEERSWSQSLRGIRQAGFCEGGLVRYALAQDGTFRQYGAPSGILGETPLRLVGGSVSIYGISGDNRLLTGEGEAVINWVFPHAPGPGELARVVDIEDNGCRVLLLTDDGKVFAAKDDSGDTEPDWENWTEIAGLEASAAQLTPGTREFRAAYAAVRKDGTVLAAPDELAGLIGNWTDMAKIAIGDRWALGLKRDGTVLSAGFAGAVPPDVSGWKDIADLDAGSDYCVGIRSDGTAVFAGEFIFMREGHSRR